MLSEAQKQQFDRDGYLLVPGVFSAEQVASVRRFLTGLFDQSPTHDGDYNDADGSVRFDACARYEELRWILLHPPIVETLRDLLGKDLVYMPETVVHDSMRGVWHKDTSAQERAGHRFHWEPDYRLIQAAIYMQDNTVNYGGGLDIIPGSYTQKDAYSSVLQRVGRRLTKQGLWFDKKGITSIPSKAGDLVLFHFRSDHRGTPATVFPIPDSERKFSFFFPASPNDRYVEPYCNYIATRADYLYLFKHRYPDAFVEEARRQGIVLARPSVLPATPPVPRKRKY